QGNDDPETNQVHENGEKYDEDGRFPHLARYSGSDVTENGIANSSRECRGVKLNAACADSVCVHLGRVAKSQAMPVLESSANDGDSQHGIKQEQNGSGESGSGKRHTDADLVGRRSRGGALWHRST